MTKKYPLGSWQLLGPQNSISLQRGRCFEVAGHKVAVFRSLDNDFFATDNLCPHKKGPLAEGLVHGHKVSCPLHDRTFDLKTGVATGFDTDVVKTYPIQIVDGNIKILFESHHEE